MLLKRPSGAPAFLASVRGRAEALTALHGGAEIIDAKEPETGALGALPLSAISDIVSAIAGRVPVSATIGDLPSEPRTMCRAAEETAASGVDIVKAGFFGPAPHGTVIAALGRLNLGGARLAGVLMADEEPDFSLVSAMADAGFVAVILDTANKGKGGLRQALDEAKLKSFLSATRRAGVAGGLAGSLVIEDIAPLAALKPDVLGFRGALCVQGRSSALDPSRVAAVRTAMTKAGHVVPICGPMPERTVA